MQNINNNSAQRKAGAFKALHQRPGIFVIPNPWDAGSAKVLASFGFQALATTSAGLGYTLGKADGNGSVTREDTLSNAKSIVDATSLPVSADLENGYGHDPFAVVETIKLASLTGLAGGSIEDATGNPADPIYPFELSVARIKSAVEAVRKLSQPFTLTARAENLIYGKVDMRDTIRRLEAYAEAGADVLFAPGLTTREQVATVVSAVAPKPVNVLMGFSGGNFSLSMLEEIGVKRVSLGSSLARAAYGALFKAIKEISGDGTFNYAKDATPYADLNDLFKDSDLR